MKHFLIFTPNYVRLLPSLLLLEKIFLESKLVWKIVKSLFDRFQSKIIAIEERKNLGIMKVKELAGSLKTFELNLKQRKKEKFITLKAEKTEGLDFK